MGGSMIIWTGWGVLSPALFFASTLGFAGVFDLLGANSRTGAAIGALLAGVGVWLIGIRMNRPVPGYDRRTGEPVTYKNHHTLFWIPMQYSAVLGIPIALWAAWW
jgi:hypothetical protein